MIPFILPEKPDLEMFNKLVTKSVERNHYTNFGVNHNTLKEKFSELAGIDKIVLACNASVILDGIHDILSRKCIEAYLPSFTFPATNLGCRIPRFYGYTVGGGANIGRATWNISPSIYNYAVTVNPFGTLNKPCGRPNVEYWIVDNAAGLITQAKDWLDAGADAVIYSLHATKILSACEGGVVFFKDDSLYKEYEEYINFGFKIFKSNVGPLRSVGCIGSNHKMSELSAAWCLMGLDRLDENLKYRIQWANIYEEFCKLNDIVYIYSPQAFWILGKKPANVIQKFAFGNNVDIRPYYQKLLKGFPLCQTTESFTTNGFCIPTRSTLTLEENDKIYEMLCKAKKLDLI